MMRLTLVTGGARSGKSRHALGRAGASGVPVTFIATAEPGDPDMEERILRHRAERPAAWTTVEAPLEASAAVRQAHTSFVVLDCLTLLVSNTLLSAGPEHEEGRARVSAEVEHLLEARAQRDGHLVLVTNEVGLGVVPATPLGRVFRDVLGDANRRLAEVADEVVLMVSGIPVPVRGGPAP